MDKEIKEAFVETIRRYCFHSSKAYRMDAYSMKAEFERLTGFYIGCNDFVALLEGEGYKRNKRGRFYIFIDEVADVSPHFRGHGNRPWIYDDFK